MRSIRFGAKVVHLLICLIIVSCKKDDELPSKVVFGDPAEIMVFNLQVFDPEISNKSVQISAPLFGNARLVVNNTFIIYEPGANFENDKITLSIEGQAFAEVIFFSKDLTTECQPFARSYKITAKKNEGPFSFQGFFNFCSFDDRKDIYLSATEITPNTDIGIGLGSGIITFYAEPKADFTGTQELIYEVGSAQRSFNGKIYESDYLLSGLIQVTVTE